MKDGNSSARLLIADDHALVREGMRTMLAREPDLEVIGEAENGREALELCRSLRPDLVLMDIRMALMDGIEATRAIKEEYPTVGVLMVTTHESPDQLLDAVRAGAAGYILKDATRQQMVEAVRGVLDGGSPLNQELAMRLLRTLAEEAERRSNPKSLKEHRESLSEPATNLLTAREVEVLGVLAMGKTNREVARSLTISLSTVKTHIHRIIEKLGVSDRTQAAVRAAELSLLPTRKGE